VPGAGNASVIARWGIGPIGVVLSTRALVAIGIIVMLALVQVRGVRPGRVLQNSLTTVTVFALVAFVVVGLIVAPSPPAAVVVVTPRAPLTAWLIALVPVMFSYTGWNAAVYVAEEVRDPTRNVPLALGLGSGFSQSLGISIVGGLMVSQLLTLFTTPVVYLYLDGFRLRCRRLWQRWYPAPLGISDRRPGVA